MNDKRIENDKRNLLNELINATREVKAKFGEHKKVISSNEVLVQNLLRAWENACFFGLKISLLSNVQELFNTSSNNPSFWPFVYQFLSNDEQKRFTNFKNVSKNFQGHFN